jgi:L-rhamnose mutarotase
MKEQRRYGNVFRIDPNQKEDYHRAHDEIWPEMAEAIRASGIRNYSLFYREDRTIFSYFEAADADAAAAYLSAQEVNTRWQKAMERYFVKDDPAILGPDIHPLEEVFHLD